MSNEYNDWLAEQTFETLANDNIRIKQKLLSLDKENTILTVKLEKTIESLKLFFDNRLSLGEIGDRFIQTLKEVENNE